MHVEETTVTVKGCTRMLGLLEQSHGEVRRL